MKRPTPGIDTEGAYQDICNGISRDMLDVCYGPPLEVISSCIRHFVQDSPRMLNDADYAAIEARIVAWLAGQEDALEQYRAYDAAETPEEKVALDPYRLLAAHIYGLEVAEITKFPHRHVGKHAKLGLGFGMGSPKFRVTVKKQGNYDLPLGLEDTAVAIFRGTNKKIVSFWYDMERAAKRAIVNKGKAFQVNKITFLCRDVEGIPFLLMQLPSKRKLAYPHPRMVDDRIKFFGNIKGATWGEITTWGGSLVENATQAVAMDILVNGVHNADKAGYKIATLIHDQALSYVKPGQSAEEFVQLLTKLPAWAGGLPIAAEGSLVPFYKKD
jgi:DNA polymerase